MVSNQKLESISVFNDQLTGLVDRMLHGDCSLYIEQRFDHKIISTAFLLPSPDSRRVVVSYKRKYVNKELVNGLVKLAQEKSVVRCTDRPDMTIAVDWDVRNQTNKQTKH